MGPRPAILLPLVPSSVAFFTSVLNQLTLRGILSLSAVTAKPYSVVAPLELGTGRPARLRRAASGLKLSDLSPKMLSVMSQGSLLIHVFGACRTPPHVLLTPSPSVREARLSGKFR